MIMVVLITIIVSPLFSVRHNRTIKSTLVAV